MTFNRKYKVNEEDENVFEFKSKQEEYEHEAKMLMFKFLSEIEKLNDSKRLLKKELAFAIGTSASYITQLYNGDKLVNLITLAKLQDVYNIEFDVKAISNQSSISVNAPVVNSNKSELRNQVLIRNYDNNLTFVYGKKNTDFHKKVS